MELNKIENEGKWSEQTTRLNSNFNKINQETESLKSTYRALTQSDVLVVSTLPAEGVANTIYRVVGNGSYSDYMYNSDDLTTPILMATYNNAIDTYPQEGSENLITSGAVYESMQDMLEQSAVRTDTSQDLTDAQKATALGNLGISGIDDVPVADSSNLVKSGGVKSAIDTLQDNVTDEIEDFENVIRTQIDEYKPIVINGDVTNAADEEDLTSSNGLLKLKNRNSLYGMGKIILRRNQTFVEQLTQTNTIYIIQYDFDLNGATVTIPENCVLQFEGGSLSNGELNIDETIKIESPSFYNIAVNGWNTGFTGNNVDITKVCKKYLSYQDDNIYGLANAINTFLNNLKYSQALTGIVIKVPSGRYIIEQTIHIPIGVSLIGCSGTEFVLDFTSNENNEVTGIEIDHYYMTPPSIPVADSHYGLSVQRDKIENLGIRGITADNNYVGIHDNHGTHNINHIRFANLKRYLVCTENYTGRLRYYGDNRTISNLFCSAPTQNTYKIHIANGDAQTIENVLGYVGIIVIGAHIVIKNCISTDFTLINCRATIINLHCEANGILIYNSYVNIDNSILGNVAGWTPLTRNNFLNNLEADTYRIIQRAFDDGIITGEEGGENPLLPGKFNAYIPNASIINLNNVLFLGLGKSRDTIFDSSNEFFNIKKERNTQIVYKSIFTQYDFKNSPNILIGFPSGITKGGGTISSLSNPVIKLNEVITFPTSLTITATAVEDTQATLEPNTYYYKFVVVSDVYRSFGAESAVTSVTIQNGQSPRITIDINGKVFDGRCIILYRGTAPTSFNKMLVMYIPYGGSKGIYYGANSGGNYSLVSNYLFGIDSNLMFCSYKWENNIRASITQATSFELIKTDNYKFVLPKDIHYYNYSIVKNGDIIVDSYGNTYEVVNNAVNNPSKYKLISVGTLDETTQRPILHNYACDKGWEHFDTTLNKPIYWTGTAWVDALGNPVE